MKPVKIAYFGSPDFSAQVLNSLFTLKGFKVVAVVTTPDKPQGRRQTLEPSAVAKVAKTHDLPTFKPQKLDAGNLAHLMIFEPDIFVVAAYGKIIPKSWLESPKYGVVNIHFSLLPRWRGALCVSEAIRNQDSTTGISLMVMDERLDHGPIIAQAKVTINEQDCQQLLQELTQLAEKIIPKVLPAYVNWKKNYQSSDNPDVWLPPKKQTESQATYTPKTHSRDRKSAYIPWSRLRRAVSGNNAAKLVAKIRSLNPDPGAWTECILTNGKKLELKLIKTKLNQGKLVIEQVQLPGRNPVTWQQFQTGRQIKN